MILLEEHFDYFHRAKAASATPPGYVTGKWGYAIHVGGSGGVYSAPYLQYDGSYFPASGVASFWLKLNALPSYDYCTIFDSRDVSAPLNGDIEIGIRQTGKPFIAQYKTSTVQWHFANASTALTLGTWYWIVCRWGILGLHIYINGIDESTWDPSGSTQLRSSGTDIWLGAYPYATGGINAEIDWLRIADASTTAWQAEILDNPVLGFRLEHDDGYFVFPTTFSPGTIQMDSRIDAIDVPRRNGAYIGCVPSLASRRVQIRGMFAESTPLLLRGVMDHLHASLNRGVQKLHLWNDRYVNVVKTGFSTDYDETSFSRYCNVAIDFQTEEPFQTESVESSDTWTSPTTGTTRDIVAGGTAYATLVCEITAASAGTLDIELALGDYSFSLLGSVHAGDVIEVDVSAQAVVNDSYDSYEYMNFFDGRFFALQPGINELGYTHNSGVAVSSIVTRWRNRWH